MTKIDKKGLIDRGWKELFWNFPAELFFAKNSKEPWTKLPHLHINYKVNRSLHSFTYKNEKGKNLDLYRNGQWLEKNIEKIAESALAEEVRMVFIPK